MNNLKVDSSSDFPIEVTVSAEEVRKYKSFFNEIDSLISGIEKELEPILRAIPPMGEGIGEEALETQLFNGLKMIVNHLKTLKERIVI